MTTINRTHSEHNAVALTIAKFLETAAARIRDGYIWRRNYNRTFRELSGLEDRDLHDLGLSRADIPRISAEAAQDSVNRTTRA